MLREAGLETPEHWSGINPYFINNVPLDDGPRDNMKKKDNSMKKMFVIFIIVGFSALYLLGVAYAGIWDKCKVCHNGSTAPEEQTLKKRYKTADEFMKAAKESPNPMMNNYKGDADLKEAAKYLDLK
jgi:hypothetical protein